MDQIMSLPFEVAVAALFVIVMLRANATYWLGRGATAGAARSKLGRHLTGPKADTARKLIARWGPWAVMFSFLTIGIQTAVNLTAGAGKMPLKRYVPAVVVGSLMWAFLYATVGLAAIDAWITLAGKSPWTLAGLGLLLVVIALTIIVRRRRATPAERSEPLDARVEP
ncbi:DedA family protein [Pseudarthrobacter sp. J1738]|uniref:DedA family protein n=1 Tax=unclassified Pseudarthrobacter TaxID=2647000 RepID=UPI003D29E9C5